LLSATLLAGCGGSDDDAAPAPKTGANVSAGTITGFSANSIIVNGTQYDKREAQVLDDDGSAISAAALKLGMQVEVQSSGNDPKRGVGRAGLIAFGAAVVGPVEAVDADGRQMTVLGQTIQLSDGTVFGAEIPGGLADVKEGQILSVHGLLDAASGVTTATRVDLKASVNLFRLRGVVSELNADDKTLRIGGQLVNVADVPARQLEKAALADGQVVRAVLKTERVNDQLVARSINPDRRFVEDGKAVDIEGVVTQFTSATEFKLSGLLVDAGNATTYVNRARLKRGARVEVKGSLAGGVLTADTVNVKVRGRRDVIQLQGELETLDGATKSFTLNGVRVFFGGKKVTFVGGDAARLADGVGISVTGNLLFNGQVVDARSIEFTAPPPVVVDQAEGAVANLDAAAKTFKVGDVTVNFGDAVMFIGGDATELADGVNVLVKGTLSADGAVLTAQSIEFIEPEPAPGEVEGAVADLDAGARTFKLGAVTVDFSGEVTFVGGDAAALANDVNVLVKGTLSADGSELTAQSIEFVE
jgi:hypothetical protein